MDSHSQIFKQIYIDVLLKQIPIGYEIQILDDNDERVQDFDFIAYQIKDKERVYVSTNDMFLAFVLNSVIEEKDSYMVFETFTIGYYKCENTYSPNIYAVTVQRALGVYTLDSVTCNVLSHVEVNNQELYPLTKAFIHYHVGYLAFKSTNIEHVMNVLSNACKGEINHRHDEDVTVFTTALNNEWRNNDLVGLNVCIFKILGTELFYRDMEFLKSYMKNLTNMFVVFDERGTSLTSVCISSENCFVSNKQALSLKQIQLFPQISIAREITIQTDRKQIESLPLHGYCDVDSGVISYKFDNVTVGGCIIQWTDIAKFISFSDLFKTLYIGLSKDRETNGIISPALPIECIRHILGFLVGDVVMSLNKKTRE